MAASTGFCNYFQFGRSVTSVFGRKFVRSICTNNQRVLGELAQFSEEQEKVVLEQINSRSEVELSNTKGIGKVKGKAIMEHRLRNGVLTSLEQLANIRGFGKGFFRNVLEANCSLPIQQKANKLASLLTEDQKNNISNLVSIDIGLNNAAYVHINRDKHVLNWKRVSIPVPKPYSPGECTKVVQQVVGTFPDADLYLVELQSHRASRSDPMMFPFVLHLRIVEAMLHCLLADKLVLGVNPFITAKYFGLPYGLRKKKAAVDLTSFMIQRKTNVDLMKQQPDVYFEKSTKLEGAKETVSTILATATMETKDFDMKWCVDFPDYLIQYFLEQKKKDDLSDCLLQALAFLDLAF